MNIFCNPVNFSYKYQFNKQKDGGVIASRESADPSMILFKGKYYIFPSMTAGFLYSDDLAHWDFHPTSHLPIYDYAPDVRAAGDYLYFCASSHEHGLHYRTTDPFGDEYERKDGAFPFWDPDLLVDDDGRFYFYWGSSTTEPLYGVELDPQTLQPIGEKKELCAVDTEVKGYERNGEDHVPSRTPEQIEMILAGMDKAGVPEATREAARGYIMELPYMEGVWVNKHGGKYYLQYGTPSSGHNIYGDGVYVSDQPLGPFELARNNPYSYKPGGFLPGAGHGSTMEDKNGDVWHISTMRICMNHNFERRIGLWPAGFDADGELFCNQRYGDWPMDVEKLKENPWADPQWMLLSYHAKASASSVAEPKRVLNQEMMMLGKREPVVTAYTPENAADENVQTWWKAATAESGEWLALDLGKVMDVHAIQVNFADDGLVPELPEGFALKGALMQERWIDPVAQKTRWLLEGSVDGEEWFVIEDKREAETDLPHDLVVLEEGRGVRHVRLTVTELPYGQVACVSGLRVFGLGDVALPGQVKNVKAVLRTPFDKDVAWEDGGDVAQTAAAGGEMAESSEGKAIGEAQTAGTNQATGYVVQWGFAPEKLYHSYMVFEPKVSIGGLVKDQDVYLRVDAFNESGITEGEVMRVR